jgi:hypothetical protein
MAGEVRMINPVDRHLAPAACCAMLLALSCVCETKPSTDHKTEMTRESCEGREVGEQWSIDCNDCYCDETGQPVCTRLDCRAGSESPGLGAR